MGYISKRSLENLNKYSYKGVDKSLLSKYVLTPYWNQLVKLWPTWVAPNTITLTGLTLVFINFLTLLYYDPAYLTPKHGAPGPPQWIYFTWAAGLFMYQSLDAIDGKQARRTGMAGPLGEMFDHGCDAINTTLEVILACYALNLGRTWWTVASQIGTLATFYLTTWEEYHTGQLFLGVFSGPVEGIIMIVCIYIISGIYGVAFWDTSILSLLRIDRIDGFGKFLPDIPLNETFMVIGGFGLGFNIYTSYTNVRRSLPRTASLYVRVRPVLRLLPFPFACAINVFWLSARITTSSDSATSVPASPPVPGVTPAPELLPTPISTLIHTAAFVPFLCAWGLQFAHQVGRMILAHVTSSKRLPWLEWLWIVALAGGIDAHMPLFFGRPPIIQSTPLRSLLAVYLYLALSAISYGRFCYLVIDDITNFLGIACFTVRKKDARGQWKSVDPENSKANNDRKKTK